MKAILAALLSLFACITSIAATPVTLSFFQTDSRYHYRIELLQLAMEKTLEADGPYQLLPLKTEMTQGRGVRYLQQGTKVNIAFLPANKQRETDLLSVKIPILRGLLGYRVSLIRKESLNNFSQIDHLEQLQHQFTAGFGSQWADMEILKFNKLKVFGTPKYENLFGMLSAGRFDYFPRGLNEVWDEINHFSLFYPNLTVDPYTALYYPYPVYFYVNRKDQALADRIERGLKIALEDGSFKALFLEHHREWIARANLEKRKIFILKNPTLPEGLPLPDTNWWLPDPIAFK